MTLDQFISKYMGKTVGYPDGQYVGECLSLVKWYCKDVFNFDPPPSGSNSAYGYWSNFPAPLSTYFTKVANTPDGVPKRGDIIIWDTNAGGGYGHIAIFLEGTASSFKSLDQNWNGKQTHEQGHYYTNVVGWLTPIMPEKTYTQAEWQTERDERNKNWTSYQNTLTKVTELERNIEERTKVSEAKEREDQSYFDDLVTTLAPDPSEVGGMSSRQIVKYEVEKFLGKENDLIRKLSESEKLVEHTEKIYKAKISSFEKQLIGAQEQIDELTRELKSIKDIQPPKPQEKPISSTLTGFSRLIQSIISVIRRLLWK